MSSSIISTQPETCQQPARDAQRDAPDAALALERARRETRLERARQCRAQAWSILFFVDACDDERTIAAWLAERETLLREAERLEKGCES